ncbi:hypothetical protein V6N13_051743 [Hibiscus sabdariffa]
MLRKTVVVIVNVVVVVVNRRRIELVGTEPRVNAVVGHHLVGIKHAQKRRPIHRFIALHLYRGAFLVRRRRQRMLFRRRPDIVVTGNAAVLSRLVRKPRRGGLYFLRTKRPSPGNIWGIIGEVELSVVAAQTILRGIECSGSFLGRVERTQPDTFAAVGESDFRHPFPPFPFSYSLVLGRAAGRFTVSG